MGDRWRRLPATVLVLWGATLAFAQGGTHPAEAAAAAQLHEAIVTAQHGDVRQALVLTQTLLSQHPKFGPAFKFQGALLEDSGQDREAEASYEQALQLLPTDDELMLKVGTYELVAGNNDEAIRLLTRRSKQVPRDGETLFYLAQAYHLKGENDAALTAIAKAVQLDPKNVAFWQKYGELLCSSGDNEAGLRWLKKAQMADPSLERIDFDLGVASYKNQDLENAAGYAAKAAMLQPNDLKALALLAEVDVKLAKWDEAKPAYERILAVHPDDPASLLGLGHCDLALKQYEAAANALERLLQGDPTQVLAHFYLSRVYAGLGRTADAQHESDLHNKLLEQAASATADPEREGEKQTLVQARQLLTEGHEAGALQLFRERAKGPTATRGAPYMLVGVVYLYMGRTDDADRSLHKALAIEPAVRGAHTYLGLLDLEQADLDGAEGEFGAELAGEPNSQLAVAELGEVRYRQGRWTEAAEQISKSKTVEPRLLYMLCDSYFHLGKVREADLIAELVVDYAKREAKDGNSSLVERVIALLQQNGQTELAQRLSGE